MQQFQSMDAVLKGVPVATQAVELPATAEDLVVTVHSDPAAIEQIWRALEARAAIAVYQRYDWVLPWCRHAAPSLGVEPLIVLGSRRGRPAFILPLGRRRCRTGREVSWLGCSHVNIAMGLFDPDFASALDADFVRGMFDRVAAAVAPVDFFTLHNQPAEWLGIANPLRQLDGCMADQPVIAIPLATTFDAMLNQRKRKKHRWQVNTLASVGGYRFFRAETRDEALRILEIFLAQKEEHFARMGVDNVFADPGTVACYRSMIVESFKQREPIIQLYALEIAGEIRATFAAGVHQDREHGFFSGISFDDYQRVSPGDLLLYNLIKEACESGRRTLDLGVGEERYKSAWSPVSEEQFRTLLPVTLKGRLSVFMLRQMHRLKLRIRSDDTRWQRAKRFRAWAARLRTRSN